MLILLFTVLCIGNSIYLTGLFYFGCFVRVLKCDKFGSWNVSIFIKNSLHLWTSHLKLCVCVCVGIKCFAGLGVWEGRVSSLHQKLVYTLVTSYMLRGIFGLYTSLLSRNPRFLGFQTSILKQLS